MLLVIAAKTESNPVVCDRGANNNTSWKSWGWVVCFHLKTMDIKHTVAPVALLCNKNRITCISSACFGLSMLKGFVFWGILFAANKSAETKQADRNKTKMSDPEKLNSEKVSSAQLFFSPHYHWAAFQLCATVTHSVSVWAGISVYYLRRHGHSAWPAVSVWSLVGEAALAEWSWTSHIVLCGGRKCRLNGTEHNTHSLISAANASVIETPAGDRFHLAPLKWSGVIVYFCFHLLMLSIKNGGGGGSFEKHQKTPFNGHSNILET